MDACCAGCWSCCACEDRGQGGPGCRKGHVGQQPGAAAWRRGCCGTAVGGAGWGRSLAAGEGAHAQVEVWAAAASCWLARTAHRSAAAGETCELGPCAKEGGAELDQGSGSGNAGWVWGGGGGARQRQRGWVQRARGGGSGAVKAAAVRATEGKGARQGGVQGRRGRWPSRSTAAGSATANVQVAGRREGGRQAGRRQREWGNSRGCTVRGVAVGRGVRGGEGCVLGGW